MTLGDLIRSVRLQLGITQVELGKRSKMDHSRIQSIECGRVHNPTLRTIRRLAEGLGLRAQIVLRRPDGDVEGVVNVDES